MIIECVNCGKKFDVNPELIPDKGRTIQCGSCNHVWFFKKGAEVFNKNYSLDIEKKHKVSNKPINLEKKEKNIDKASKKSNKDVKLQKGYELTKYQPKKKFTFSKLLSYLLVIIITFIAFIIVIDTFKSPLFKIVPGLEFMLFNFFETLKDIHLFIKDLI